MHTRCLSDIPLKKALCVSITLKYFKIMLIKTPPSITGALNLTMLLFPGLCHASRQLNGLVSKVCPTRLQATAHVLWGQKALCLWPLSQNKQQLIPWLWSQCDGTVRPPIVYSPFTCLHHHKKTNKTGKLCFFQRAPCIAQNELQHKGGLCSERGIFKCKHNVFFICFSFCWEVCSAQFHLSIITKDLVYSCFCIP